LGKTRLALILQNDPGNRFASTTIVAAITGRIKDLPALVDVTQEGSGFPVSRFGLTSRT
jgi:mRNA-degrading endonuclease toxin of MazEF toxin-antitoxin module